jgi:hypothetical protein
MPVRYLLLRSNSEGISRSMMAPLTVPQGFGRRSRTNWGMWPWSASWKLSSRVWQFSHSFSWKSSVWGSDLAR